jgi:hypothetical protein
MSTKEKETIVTLISSIVIMGFYSLYVYQNYLKEDWTLINDFKFWGTTFLIMIPVANCIANYHSHHFCNLQ